jgi:spore maturation protein CgeB
MYQEGQGPRIVTASRSFRIAYFAHSIRSDWNNGNAHYLRGLLRNLEKMGHQVTIFEPQNGWSLTNLENEPGGPRSLRQFARTYPSLHLVTYNLTGGSVLQPDSLRDIDIVFVHEWNPPELGHRLLALRESLGFRLLFHDTHHRASSSPEAIRLLGIDRFDGVIAFGEALRRIYRDRFHLSRVWTLHEAADVDVFHPRAATEKTDDLVWIGNWGDDERSAEIREFLLQPAAHLRQHSFSIYGVRYPEEGLQELRQAGVTYRGYLPNLDAPSVYSAARLTVHIPRQQYSTAMAGIPTIRVFEALACGIPLLSAPWSDSERLFREGDFCTVRSAAEMQTAISNLLTDCKAAKAQAQRGLETVRSRHTCRHRAEQLIAICEELFR